MRVRSILLTLLTALYLALTVLAYLHKGVGRAFLAFAILLLVFFIRERQCDG